MTTISSGCTSTKNVMYISCMFFFLIQTKCKKCICLRNICFLLLHHCRGKQMLIWTPLTIWRLNEHFQMKFYYCIASCRVLPTATNCIGSCLLFFKCRAASSLVVPAINSETLFYYALLETYMSLSFVCQCGVTLLNAVLAARQLSAARPIEGDTMPPFGWNLPILNVEILVLRCKCACTAAPGLVAIDQTWLKEAETTVANRRKSKLSLNEYGHPPGKETRS